MLKKPFSIVLIAGIAILLALMHSPEVFADKGRKQKGKYKQEELYDAREAGELMPLALILEKLQQKGISQVLEIESEYEDGTPIYEIYYLDNNGSRKEIEIDARTGRVFNDDDEDDEDD